VETRKLEGGGAGGTRAVCWHGGHLMCGPEPDVWAALEQACQELGYDIDYIAQFLQEREYPQELLDKIVNITGCNDLGKICSMLEAGTAM